MGSIYDERYKKDDYYWGVKPSSTCARVVELAPPDVAPRLLDIGCGEGRDAVFFARQGYRVTAFDVAPRGIEKTRQMADEAGVSIECFTADLNEFRLSSAFDILFSTGVLQYVPQGLRAELFSNYREFTAPGGLNAFSVFVRKPFIPRAPDAEGTEHLWATGELLSLYGDWLIEYCAEDIFDCQSSGIPHRHAMSRVMARKPGG